MWSDFVDFSFLYNYLINFNNFFFIRKFFRVVCRAIFFFFMYKIIELPNIQFFLKFTIKILIECKKLKNQATSHPRECISLSNKKTYSKSVQCNPHK